MLELRDRIRPEARSIVARLHAQGVKSIIMLTGDNEQTARAVAAEVGIDEVRAQLLPEDKVAAIEELAEQHEMVAMIGDGVNDAPAMARAHYAVAMGAVGSDAAIETADIALMTDDIGKVPWLIDHSRRTMSIIRQNIGFSLATKALVCHSHGFWIGIHVGCNRRRCRSVLAGRGQCLTASESSGRSYRPD